MTVFYKDQTMTLHADGTRILDWNDKSKTIIEKEGTCSVTIRKAW